MGQAESLIAMRQYQRLPQAGLALAPCAASPSHRCHLLAAGQVEALPTRRLALPAAGGQPLRERLQRANDDSRPYAD
jgi:hypothetical protein